MQFVAVKFRVSDTRTYTYSWDGEPLNEGDTVRVEDRSGDGWKKVYVVGTTDEAPPEAAADDRPHVDWNSMVDADGDDPLGGPLAF